MKHCLVNVQYKIWQRDIHPDMKEKYSLSANNTICKEYHVYREERVSFQKKFLPQNTSNLHTLTSGDMAELTHLTRGTSYFPVWWPKKLKYHDLLLGKRC